MIALLLHILFSTAFGLIVKDSQARGRNLWAVGAVNYITAAFAALIFTMAESSLTHYQFSGATLIIGLFAGAGYVVSYFFLLTIVQHDGISIPMAVARLSVVVPILFSIFYWREIPNGYQIIGIFLVCLSLPLLGQNQPNSETDNGAHLRKENLRRAKLLIFILFFLTGWCTLSSKIFVQTSSQDSREIFLLLLFGTAAVISVAPLIIFRIVPTIGEVLPGILLGLCNIYQNHFLLISLGKLPGILVFPIANSSALVLTTLLAVAVWHERLRRPAIVGIVISVLALVFINLKP